MDKHRRGTRIHHGHHNHPFPSFEKKRDEGWYEVKEKEKRKEWNGGKRSYVSHAVRAECGVFLKAGTFRRSIDWQRVGRNCRRARTPAPSLSFLSPASTNTPLLPRPRLPFYRVWFASTLHEPRYSNGGIAGERLHLSPVSSLFPRFHPSGWPRCHVCVPPTHPRPCRTSQFSVPGNPFLPFSFPFPFLSFPFFLVLLLLLLLWTLPSDVTYEQWIVAKRFNLGGRSLISNILLRLNYVNGSAGAITLSLRVPTKISSPSLIFRLLSFEREIIKEESILMRIFC